ncbi:pre-mRNA-splicing factor CWC26 [Ephemerocybe angulata]|uniref:Pre-mRNA-splicing factor CWC26 n=1 Tax=Ephemerocybe angulata TaxID=980116 RepID=A0A8H6M748_9AGAR|nr:pre-mRNA-splicing factor CWC26 [Tulosesus angulatus]
MSDLKSYLAEKYMSGPKADAILAKTASQTKKKRRRARPSTSTSAAGGGVMLVDEDAGWPSKDRGRGGDDDDEDALKEAVVASDRGFKKRKVGKEGDSTWVTVQKGLAGSSSGVKEEEEEPTPLDEQPTVVENAVSPAEDIARAQETVYRDSSGRKVDMKAAKAEAARLKREREEKEAQKMEWGKGLFARGVDDADLNEELKSKELWNDPAAAFLSKNKKKGPRKPEYSGPPPPPNRFGIKPGYRWDGVDRGNGFEKKLFQSVNARKRKGAESYAWGAEDM